MTDDGDVAQVIADLKKAVGVKGKKVIEAYRYEDDHTKNVERISSKKMEELKPVCEVLRVWPTGRFGAIRNASLLADMIVLRIEGLFPMECQDCGEEYRVELGTKPPVSCFLCGQGGHSCKTTVGGNRKGSIWLCLHCYKKNEANVDDWDHPDHSGSSNEEDNSPNPSQADLVEEEEVPEQQTQEVVPGDRRTPASGNALDIRPGNVCTFYLNHKCRHGRKGMTVVQGKACPKLHPALCRKYCKYGGSKRLGCTKGTTCKYYHPPLCKGSDAKRECYDKNCTLTHLSHTKRRRDKEEGPSQDATVKERTRKSYSQAVGEAELSFAPKRQRQSTETEIPSVLTQKSSNMGSITTDFLLRALEELKAEIHLSVGRQLTEFKSSLELQAGMKNQPTIWGTAGTRPLYQSFCS